jgi:hypothetical protein
MTNILARKQAKRFH